MMRPSRDSFGCSQRVPVLVPVLEGFFQMELDGVDQLALGALDHHLVTAQIGRGEKLKTLGTRSSCRP